MSLLASASPPRPWKNVTAKSFFKPVSPTTRENQLRRDGLAIDKARAEAKERKAEEQAAADRMRKPVGRPRKPPAPAASADGKGLFPVGSIRGST